MAWRVFDAGDSAVTALENAGGRFRLVVGEGREFGLPRWVALVEGSESDVAAAEALVLQAGGAPIEDAEAARASLRSGGGATGRDRRLSRRRG